MINLVIATRNLHKVQEIRSILGPDFGYLHLADYPEAPMVVEDAPSFSGNAVKKAVTLAKWLAGQGAGACWGMYVVADDSGLEVDALNGAPGVHSARFAGLQGGEDVSNSPDEANNSKLLRLLANIPDEQRTARFRCVIAVSPVLAPEKGLASPACDADAYDLQTQIFEGVCEGRVGREPRGTGGFGYDPLFIPEGFSETFAELSEQAKNRISHRARALADLKKRFRA